MNNPKCAVCGHINRAGAAACEMCDTRLGSGAGAHGAGPHRTGEGSGAWGGGFGAEGREAGGGGALPTDIPAPQFKGAADVITPTLEIYRKHFLLVGLLVVVTTLPAAFFQYAASGAAFAWGGELEGEGIGASAGGGGVLPGGLAALLYWLSATCGYALLSGALAYAVVQVQRAGSAGAGASLLWGLRKLPKVAAVLLLTYLLAYGIPGVVAAFMAVVLGPLVLIPILLLLLPWVVMVLTLSLSVPAAVIENRGVVAALRRSAELTRGYKGLIFLTYFLWWVVITVLGVAVNWSFSYGAAGGPAASVFAQLLVQMLVSGMLNSSMSVLLVYIFLGILNENRQGFEARGFAPAPAAR